jgi:hypothetical protein
MAMSTRAMIQNMVIGLRYFGLVEVSFTGSIVAVGDPDLGERQASCRCRTGAADAPAARQH